MDAKKHTRHKIPRYGAISTIRRRELLETCLALVEYALSEEKVIPDGVMKKRPNAAEAHAAIDKFMFEIAELESEIIDATVYDLALPEHVAQALERAGYLYVRALGQASPSELKKVPGVNAIAVRVILQRLAEILEAVK